MMKHTPIYVLHALRTPIGKLQGGLAHWRPDDLAAALIQALLRQAKVAPEHLDGILLGCANQAGEDNRNVARMASILSELPNTCTALTFNSLCSSGLESILAGIRRIALGEGDCYVAGGVESMSRAPWVRSRTTDEEVDSTIGWRFIHPQLPDACPPLSMSETAERVAQQHGIGRDALDAYAYESRQRYQAALDLDQWAPELLPLARAKGGAPLQRDEAHRLLRPAVLAKMPPLVAGGQHITAGNAARVGDGAAVVLLASAAYVERHGLTPMAQVLDWQSAAWDPVQMSYSAVVAAQRLLARHQILSQEWGIIHWSESFALQPLLGQQVLGLPAERINPKGGALSIGNPIAVGAARDVVSLVHQLPHLSTAQYGLSVTAGGLGTSAALLLKSLGS